MAGQHKTDMAAIHGRTVCIGETVLQAAHTEQSESGVRMTQGEKRVFLISRLLEEQPQYAQIKIPAEEGEQKKLLRSLFNIRMPAAIGEEFIKIQNEYLQSETKGRGITELSELSQIEQDIYLWQGDITALRGDAVVNAANSQMLGCFCPCHGCIDNAIHTYAGIQLRNECDALMKEKRKIYGGNYEEPTGRAMITKGYNLPCSYVIHTVGPIVSGQLRKTDCEQLSRCYRSCLEAALENEIQSIAFCCISTGEFHFPNEKAAQIAVETVREFKRTNRSRIEVVFNVFKEIDYEIYRAFFGCTDDKTQN